jgi:hypothetical protein
MPKKAHREEKSGNIFFSNSVVPRRHFIVSGREIFLVSKEEDDAIKGVEVEVKTENGRKGVKREIPDGAEVVFQTPKIKKGKNRWAYEVKLIYNLKQKK